MNARLYDPVLRRFLSPDNEISDPFNTQSYDQFSYVLNNPLLYIDQSGNNPLIIVAAIIFAGPLLQHAISNMIQGIPFCYGMGKVAAINVVSCIKFWDRLCGKCALGSGKGHGAGGLAWFSGRSDGGKFISGFAAEAIFSLISSGIGALSDLDDAVSDTGKYIILRVGTCSIPSNNTCCRRL